ncbi:MAG: hypothetical protein HW416_3129 [Chloroflexi bacterium]|nr:hypothetical protein [Chloroflexota bacterium]
MRLVIPLALTLALLASGVPSSPSFAQSTATPTATSTSTATTTATATATATPGLTVSAVAPTSGSAVSPTPITVTGTGFVPGSTVMLDGRGQPTTFVDATTLRVTIPVGLALGAHTLSVINPDNATSPLLAGGFSIFGLGSVLYVPIAVRNAAGDDSGIQVQNNSPSQATVYLAYYDQSGNAVFTSGPQSVAAGDSHTFYQPGESGLPGGFDGSAVAHSTQPVSAIVNRVNYSGALAYSGSLTVPSAAATTQVNVPLVYGGMNGYNTTLSIQNTSTAAATYTVALQQNGFASPTASIQVQIPSLAVRRIRIGSDVAVPTNFVGAAMISSSASLIAVGETRNTSLNVMLGYAGIGVGATTMNAPLLFKNASNGWVSGVQVVNMANATVTLNASLRNRDSGIAFGLPPITLSPNQANFYDLGALTALPDEWIGSGVFTATGPIGVTVQSINAGKNTGLGYSAFSTGTSSISIPLVFNDYQTWNTGVQVQNLGTADAFITITYALLNGLTISETDTAGPGNSVTFYQPANTALPTNFVGSATVTSNGQPIVAIVNEVNYARGGDAAMAYEGINH